MTAPARLHATFVIPTYNRARYIAECLRSVAGQDAADFSIVVVDDCSTDDTKAIVGGLGLTALRYVVNERNLGASQSRNLAAGLAEGELLVFIDSDDRLHPQHLTAVREVFRRERDVGIVSCDSRIIDGTGEVQFHGRGFQALEGARKSHVLREGPRSFEDVFVFPTSFPGMTVRRSVIRRVGGFDGGMFPLDDVDLQLRAVAAGIGLFYIDRILADYRSHGGSESAGQGRAVRTCLKKVECLRRWWLRAPKEVSRHRLRRRLADAYLELAIAALRQRLPLLTLRAFARVAIIDPTVLATFGRWWIKHRLRPAAQ